MKRVLFAMAGVAAAAAGFVSCGGDDEKVDLTPFLGAWNLRQGAVNVMCPPLGNFNSMVGGAVNVAEGTSSDLVAKLSDPAFAGCQVQLNVKGNVATAVANQSCMFSLEGTMGTFTINSGAITAADATAASLSLSGAAVATFLGSQVNCQGTVSGNLDRTAPTADGGVDGAAAPADAQAADTGAAADATSGG